MKIKVFLLMILLIIIFFFVVITSLFAFLFFLKNGQVSSGTEFIPVCFNDDCFSAEIASSSALMKGLMFRKNLDENGGMLFIFSNEGKHAFWMKNTLIPLDIIWINTSKEIVHIAENVQPCEAFYCPSVSPEKSAKYVLEINGGKAKKAGLKIGDKAEFELR
ncbi:hypothetical protein A3J77_00705 [Candidatus Wolfebacteria bacterium RBG_13_41_7]|uniref:DUF192 domain-containing protein n=1 Tax=Candidatus Wolfebacteria bacterium RBG_13_41_7 TaxID=1802554 RepID=A0A1F8DNG9_9BACT|nr:MAG: hypothetical protein A3J77_00705 [Candidatus Wolfebacteria bacterium RBG_13_41_7]